MKKQSISKKKIKVSEKKIEKIKNHNKNIITEKIQLKYKVPWMDMLNNRVEWTKEKYK